MVLLLRLIQRKSVFCVHTICCHRDLSFWTISSVFFPPTRLKGILVLCRNIVCDRTNLKVSCQFLFFNQWTPIMRCMHMHNSNTSGSQYSTDWQKRRAQANKDANIYFSVCALRATLIRKLMGFHLGKQSLSILLWSTMIYVVVLHPHQANRMADNDRDYLAETQLGRKKWTKPIHCLSLVFCGTTLIISYNVHLKDMSFLPHL